MGGRGDAAEATLGDDGGPGMDGAADGSLGGEGIAADGIRPWPVRIAMLESENISRSHCRTTSRTNGNNVLTPGLSESAPPCTAVPGAPGSDRLKSLPMSFGIFRSPS
jgi:hypothetical protein